MILFVICRREEGAFIFCLSHPSIPAEVSQAKGAAILIISPGKNICCSHAEALKLINVNLKALCCDDDSHFEHFFNCINPPS